MKAFLRVLCGLVISIKTLKEDVSCEESVNSKGMFYLIIYLSSAVYEAMLNLFQIYMFCLQYEEVFLRNSHSSFFQIYHTLRKPSGILRII